MNAIVLALLDDPAILALHVSTLVGDVMDRFGVSRCEANRAVIEALQTARDMGTYPTELQREA